MWSFNDVVWGWQTCVVTSIAYDNEWKRCVWFLDWCYHSEWDFGEEQIEQLMNNTREQLEKVTWDNGVCTTDIYVTDGHKIFGYSWREH